MSDVLGFVNLNLGKQVCGENGQNGVLIANRTWYQDWEKFKFVNLPDGPNVIAIQGNASGNYVAVEMGGDKRLTVTRKAIGPWEKFELKIIEPATLASRGKFGLKSLASNQWVCAEPHENGLLRANRDALLGWEEFCFASGDFS